MTIISNALTRSAASAIADTPVEIVPEPKEEVVDQYQDILQKAFRAVLNNPIKSILDVIGLVAVSYLLVRQKKNTLPLSQKSPPKIKKTGTNS
ncbi:MAG: hypothetical protein LBN01_01795 [Endomicrobium sp.]|jgi:hypothetical protein|nr:hypothetical protein [Endomicrobium sp.]